MVVFRAGCTGRSAAFSLNTFLSLGIVYASICELRTPGRFVVSYSCLLLEQLLSILLVFRTRLCAGVCLEAGGTGYFLLAPPIIATARHSAIERLVFDDCEPNTTTPSLAISPCCYCKL